MLPAGHRFDETSEPLWGPAQTKAGKVVMGTCVWESGLTSAHRRAGVWGLEA